MSFHTRVCTCDHLKDDSMESALKGLSFVRLSCHLGGAVRWVFAVGPRGNNRPLCAQFLPVYSPSEEERKDPALYANNVRCVMAE